MAMVNREANNTITNLDLRNNKIGGEAGAVLADMLKQNSTITHIDLSWNDLGADGSKLSGSLNRDRRYKRLQLALVAQLPSEGSSSCDTPYLLLLVAFAPS